MSARQNEQASNAAYVSPISLGWNGSSDSTASHPPSNFGSADCLRRVAETVKKNALKKNATFFLCSPANKARQQSVKNGGEAPSIPTGNSFYASCPREGTSRFYAAPSQRTSRFYIPPSRRTSSMLYTRFSAPAVALPAKKSTASAVPSAYMRRPQTLCRN